MLLNMLDMYYQTISMLTNMFTSVYIIQQPLSIIYNLSQDGQQKEELRMTVTGIDLLAIITCTLHSLLNVSSLVWLVCNILCIYEFEFLAYIAMCWIQLYNCKIHVVMVFMLVGRERQNTVLPSGVFPAP